MFVINEKLKIVNINQDYLKTLYDADHQVFYAPKNYESKPYLGIMINDKNGNKYMLTFDFSSVIGTTMDSTLRSIMSTCDFNYQTKGATKEENGILAIRGKYAV